MYVYTFIAKLCVMKLDSTFQTSENILKFLKFENKFVSDNLFLHLPKATPLTDLRPSERNWQQPPITHTNSNEYKSSPQCQGIVLFSIKIWFKWIYINLHEDWHRREIVLPPSLLW